SQRSTLVQMINLICCCQPCQHRARPNKLPRSHPGLARKLQRARLSLQGGRDGRRPRKICRVGGAAGATAVSRWHRNFFILAFFGIMLDAMDFALFGAALPPIAREFGLGPAQSGLLATVGLIGAFVGALFWGTFSDYIGRRTAFLATVGIFALFIGMF